MYNIKFKKENINMDFIFLMTGVCLIILGLFLLYVFIISGVDVLYSNSIPLYGNPFFLLVVGFGLCFCKYFYGGMKNGV